MKKMKKILVITVLSFLAVGIYGRQIRSQVQANIGDGLINVASPYDATTTANRFEELLKAKELTMFARINHTENAAKVGQDLLPTELIIFGNPEVGTPLMQCNQTMAIDLPQKALFWTDKNGQSWLSYNDPNYLEDRHKLTGCEEIVEKVAGVLANLTEVVTQE